MKKVHLILLLIVINLSGCGSRTNMESFIRDDVDIGYVTKIAVVTFENNSRDPYVAERVRDMAITQILSYGQFDVVDKGLVDSALREEAVDLDKAPMDATLIKRMGQRLNVQAFLMGTIDESEKIQRGNISYPQLSLTLRLIDIHTGMIFWQSSGHKTGDSFGKRLFGLGHDDDFKVAIKLIRELLNTLPDPNAIQVEKEAKNSADDEIEIDEATEEDGEEIIIIPQMQDQG